MAAGAFYWGHSRRVAHLWPDLPRQDAPIVSQCGKAEAGQGIIDGSVIGRRCMICDTRAKKLNVIPEWSHA